MRLVLSCLLFLGFLGAWAQERFSVSNKAAIKDYENAEALLANNYFSEAKEKLIAAIGKENAFAEAHLLLADVYRVTFDYKNAVENYRKAFQLSPDMAPERYFYLADCELKTGKYQDALIDFSHFLASPGNTGTKADLAKKHIEDCKFAMEALRHPVKFEPHNMGPKINSAQQEYMASLTSDEQTLIFTRQINNNEDFYQSQKVGDQWEEATYLSKNINTPSYNEGAQCISPDGQFLFFTGCNRPEGLGRCDIYVSQRQGKGWSKPVNLGYPINTSGWESQPSLSADGQTLYFTSDRKGGFGSYDIWKSTLTAEGKWGNPVNLGPKINTKYSEQSPFIHPDNETLYFASDGWVGLGNKDLFISRLDSANNWGPAMNLGSPINTYGEERGLTINSSGTKAFFSSDNYKGFGGFDIYSFDLPEQIKPKYTNYVKGKVYDAETGQPLNALIEILELKTSNSLYAAYANAVDGTFLTTLPHRKQYSLNVSNPGYLFYSESFSADFHEIDKPVYLDIPLQRIKIGNKAVLRNIFFDTNKYLLKSESLTELRILADFLKENNQVNIEIRGYTDHVGEDEANLILSRNRAKAVFDYLTKLLKVDPTRLTYEGFGEKDPIADNETENGRAKNRRTEFVITKVK